MITITINTNNKTTQQNSEIARILLQLSSSVSSQEIENNYEIKDINGNIVGYLKYTEDVEAIKKPNKNPLRDLTLRRN